MEAAMEKKNMEIQAINHQTIGQRLKSYHVNGELSSEHSDAEVSGEILRLGINGYDYDSLRMKGHLVIREFNGLIEGQRDQLHQEASGCYYDH